MPLTHAYLSELARSYPPLAPADLGHDEKAGRDARAAGTDGIPRARSDHGATQYGPDDGE